MNSDALEYLYGITPERLDAMRNTPPPKSTDEAWKEHYRLQEEYIEELERELNAANERIKSLIEERDRANRLAEWKWNLRDEFQLLLGTDKIEEGIEAVKELKRRIKRLEEVAEDLVEQNDIYIRRQEWRKANEAKL